MDKDNQNIFTGILNRDIKYYKEHFGIDTGEISDTYHTFDELYNHRMVLFAVICNTYRSKAWESQLHDDGTMYRDYFIVGITTPMGDYSYHYPLIDWDKFKVKELDKAPAWDGHIPGDIDRLFSLGGIRC